jgi:hypothetical protein
MKRELSSNGSLLLNLDDVEDSSSSSEEEEDHGHGHAHGDKENSDDEDGHGHAHGNTKCSIQFNLQDKYMDKAI